MVVFMYLTPTSFSLEPAILMSQFCTRFGLLSWRAAKTPNWFECAYALTE